MFRRKLVSMVGMLVSHQDSVQGDASLGRGAKLELASCVAQLVAGAQLEPRQLGVQLALLRPSWLSAAVAKQMLTTVHQLDTNQVNTEPQTGHFGETSFYNNYYPRARGAWCPGPGPWCPPRRSCR